MNEPQHLAVGLKCPDCGQEQVRWSYMEGLDVYWLHCWICGWSMWEWSDHYGGFIYEVMRPGEDAYVVAHRPGFLKGADNDF